MNEFDLMKADMFREVTAVMGFSASWLSSVTGLITTAAHGVTFKHASLKEKEFLEYDDAFWSPENKIMEYLEQDFPGLYELVVSADGVQEIMIWDNGKPETARYYTAGSARKAFDGDSIYLQLFTLE